MAAHRDHENDDYSWIYYYKAPQIWGESMFANILPGVDACQLLAKIHPKAGKRPFVLKIQKFESKIHKHNYVCQLLGPQNVGKRPFSERYFF